MTTFKLFAVLCLFTAFPAVASPPQARDVIVVSATRQEIPLGDAIVPVTVIDRAQIEQSAATDIAELLRFEAGLDIGRNGGPGQATSLFLRGSESNHTLVLIDGVRMNPGTIGGAALQNIAPEVIERIEIVKGGRSALYGTDAIGGVINVITRRAGDGYVEAGVGVGSFGTRSGYTSAGAASERGQLGATVNWASTDGYELRTDSPLVRGNDNLSINLYGEHELGAATLGLRHWRAEGNTEYLDFFLDAVDQDYRNETTAVELANPLGAARSKLVLSYMVDDITQNQVEDFVTSRRAALDWQVSVPAGDHLLAAGVYATHENADVLSFGSGFEEATDTRAVFLQDSLNWGRHRAFVAGRYTDHETFGGEFTWNAEYALDVTERLSFGAGLGHAFRAPDATDRYGFGGNVDLEPEVSDEVQLNAAYEITPAQSVRIEVYRNDIEDLIEFDNSDFMLHNLSEARLRGAQLGWQYGGDLIDARADLLVQRAENGADGSQLLRRPERSLTVNLSRRIGEHNVGISVLASGERRDLDEVLPGYVLVNLTAQLRLASHWQLNARIENVLDTEYQTAAPYRMPEASGFLELRYLWR